VGKWKVEEREWDEKKGVVQMEKWVDHLQNDGHDPPMGEATAILTTEYLKCGNPLGNRGSALLH